MWCARDRAAVAFAALAVCAPAAGANEPMPTGLVSAAVLLSRPLAVHERIRPTVAGASPALRAVIERALSGLDSRLLTEVRIGAPPGSLRHPGQLAPPPKSLWIYVDTVVPSSESNVTYGVWEAELLAGAVHDAAVARGLPRIGGVSVKPRLPDGSPAGECCYGRAFSWSSSASVLDPDPAALTAEIRANAAREGLTIRAVSIQQPLGLAAEIDLRIRDRIRGGAEKRLVRGLLDHTEYDGVLFSVYSAEGRFLDSYAFATRARIALDGGPYSRLASMALPARIGSKTLLEQRPIVQSPVSSTITCASPALKAVVVRALGGLDSRLLPKVRIAAPPAGQKDGARRLPATALWLYVDAVEPNARFGKIPGFWEAGLLAGAIRDSAGAQGLQRIAGYTIQPVFADGAPTSAGSYSDVIDGPPTLVLDPPLAMLDTEIRGDLAHSGLTVRSIAIKEPLGLAVEIKATAPTESSGTSGIDRLRSLGLDGAYDGVLVEVYTPSAKHLRDWASGTRANAGTYYPEPPVFP